MTDRIRPNLARQFTNRMVHVEEGEDRESLLPDIEPLADALLRDAIRERASDIHLEPMVDSVRLRFRIDGELLDAAMVPAAIGDRLQNHFKAVGQLDPGHAFRPRESRLTYELDGHKLDMRLATAPCLHRETMVIRILDPETIEQNIHNLGMNDVNLQQIQQWMNSASGMLLVAGPTGSGKTTTLYALLQELKQRNRSIFTVEEPVEYQIPGVTQIPVDPLHNLTFAAGLRALLRMDPDFLMMGEIRDIDAAKAAIGAAIRGRILLSTVHSRDPFGVISALRTWGIPDHEIAVAVNMIIAQRLVRKLCPDCRHQGPPSEPQKRWLMAAGTEVPEAVWHPGSCDRCRGLGYRGRTGIFEIWQLDEDDYEAILSGKDEHGLRRRLKELGHRTMLQDGLEKLRRGLISLEELQAVPDLLPRRSVMDYEREAAEKSHQAEVAAE